MRNFLIASLALLGMVSAARAEQCETVPYSKIQEGLAIVRSGLYPQVSLLTGRALGRFVAETARNQEIPTIRPVVIAVALVETSVSYMMVTAERRGASHVICYEYNVAPATVALFRKHSEAAT